jgi:hypothetical protein
MTKESLQRRGDEDGFGTKGPGRARTFPGFLCVTAERACGREKYTQSSYSQGPSLCAFYLASLEEAVADLSMTKFRAVR